MTYQITNSIKARAKAIGVTVKSSSKAGKKLDVYKDNIKLASIGQAGAMDYHLWKKTKGESYANERRRLYHLRHKGEAPKTKNGKLTASILAKTILW